jgi:hypothetical protein
MILLNTDWKNKDNIKIYRSLMKLAKAEPLIIYVSIF